MNYQVTHALSNLSAGVDQLPQTPERSSKAEEGAAGKGEEESGEKSQRGEREGGSGEKEDRGGGRRAQDQRADRRRGRTVTEGTEPGELSVLGGSNCSQGDTTW